MKVAVIQFNAGPDKQKNIARAIKFVDAAAQRSAKLIQLPEVFNFRGQVLREDLRAQIAEEIPGASTSPFFDLARKRRVWILAGSIYECVSGRKKIFNTSLLIDPRGKIVAKYQKQNLFAAVLGRNIIQESQTFAAGHSLGVAEAGGFKVGLTICYDLRFPALYQQYSRRECSVLSVPSNFTHTTGQAHWEVLLRARAIETLSYVLAANQSGYDGKGVRSYGNSMIIGPWGDVLARASGDREEIIFAEVNQKDVQRARKQLPGIRK